MSNPTPPRFSILGPTILIASLFFLMTSPALETPQIDQTLPLAEQRLPASLKSTLFNQDLVELANQKIAIQQKKLQSDPYNHMALRGLASAYLYKMRVNGDESLLKPTNVALDKADKLASGLPALVVTRSHFLAVQHHFTAAMKLIETVDQADFSVKMTRVDLLIALGRYRAAQNELNTTPKHRKQEAWLLRQAQLHMTRGEFNASRRCYREAQKLMCHWSPHTMPWIEVMLGVTHLNAGEITEARRYFESALKLAPRYYLALEHLAETYEIEGKLDPAKRWLEQAIAIAPKPELLLRLAELETDSKKAKELESKARAELEAANNAGFIGHIRELTTFYLDREIELEKALKLAKQDLTIRNDLGAYTTLAQTLRQLGKSQEAIKTLQVALSKPAVNADLFEELVLAHTLAGNTDKALEYRDKLSKLNPLRAAELSQ